MPYPTLQASASTFSGFDVKYYSIYMWFGLIVINNEVHQKYRPRKEFHKDEVTSKFTQ